MKELLLSIALTFSQDFNKPLPDLEFRLAELDTLYGKAEYFDRWVITLDSMTALSLSNDRLKTLVYHELGHAVLGLPDNLERLNMMNSLYCLTPYKRIRK